MMEPRPKPTVVLVKPSKRRAPLLSRLALLRKTVHAGEAEQIRQFKAVLAVAENIAATDGAGLAGLIRLQGRMVQARALSNWQGSPPHTNWDPDHLLFSNTMPITPDGRSFYDLKREINSPASLSLASDIILPWPWEPKRLVRSLCNLHPGGAWGEWKQDYNHAVEMWLPWRIGWVIGGNHSIAAGIAYGTGSVTPEVAYDISEVYNYVHCDGLAYRRIHDGKKLAPVSDLEMATIFEIGRLIQGRQAS